MDDDYIPNDARVATVGQANPEQLAALRKQYATSGAPQPKDASGRAVTKNVPEKQVPDLLSKEAAAKAFQSASFGFGADIVGILTKDQNEAVIRNMAKAYDDAHPLAAMGIDLATAAAYSAIPFAGQAKAVGTLGQIGKAAAGGALYGGLMGAGSGGDLWERTKAATAGVVGGAALGAGGAYVGKVAGPLLQKMGLASNDKQAANSIELALKKDGKTWADLVEFTRQNPGARVADFSEEVANAASKAAGTSQKTATAAGNAARSDKESQLGRLTSGVQASTPLAKARQELIDEIPKLQKQRADAYTLSKTESVEVTPELQRLLEHPEINPLFKKAVDDFSAAKSAGVADLSGAPKMAFKGEDLKRLPSALLDDLQKSVGKAAQDEGTGSIRYGTLEAAQRALKNQQTGTVIDAHALAARLGGESSETGILGAQKWGANYAFGLREADIGVFKKMNPEQQQYARIGMLTGLEQYLTGAGRMSEGALAKIADAMRDPQLVEVLGKKAANGVRKVFTNEAARARVTQKLEQGGNKRVMFNEENEHRMLAHGANVALGGLGHIAGTGLRLLTASGMTEKQAQGIITIASQPGGLAKLQQMKMDKRLLDQLNKLFKTQGVVPGAAAAHLNEQSSR
jgi:hypothetical protein